MSSYPTIKYLTSKGKVYDYEGAPRSPAADALLRVSLSVLCAPPPGERSAEELTTFVKARAPDARRRAVAAARELTPPCVLRAGTRSLM